MNSVFKNKYLFNKITNHLNTFNKYQLFNDGLNQGIEEINLIKVQKYQQIISVNWMINNNLFYLLKWKLNDKSGLSGSCDTLIFTNKSIERFCRQFVTFDQSSIELFKEFYFKIGNHYFIDESVSVLCQFIANNRIDIIKFLLFESCDKFKISVQHLNMSLSNYEIFNLLWMYINENSNDYRKELPIIYKSLIPLSIVNYDPSNKSIEKVMEIYQSNIDDSNTSVKKYEMLAGSFSLKLSLKGDFDLFLKYGVPHIPYSDELYQTLLLEILDQHKITFGHLLILEYLRLDIIKSGESSYNINTNKTPSSLFFKSAISTNIKDNDNSVESELLNENNEPILNLINDIEIFQFYINYFKESIISTFRINSKTLDTDKRTDLRSHYDSKLKYLYYSIDILDLKSLEYFMGVLFLNRIMVFKDRLFDGCLDHLYSKYLYNDQIDCLTYQLNEVSIKEIFKFLIDGDSKSYKPKKVNVEKIIYSKDSTSFRLFCYLWKECNHVFLKFESNHYMENPLYNAIKYSNDVQVIKTIFNELGIKIESAPSCKIVFLLNTLGKSNKSEQQCGKETESLFEIIKFVQENIIDLNPYDFQFNLQTLLERLGNLDWSPDLKIINYLFLKYRSINYSYFKQIITSIQYQRVEIWEYILKSFGSKPSKQFLNISYWKNALSDYSIRYILSNSNSPTPGIPVDDSNPPYLDSNIMIETNNVELFCLSTDYRYHLPSKSKVYYAIEQGHIKISLFLINDYLKRTLLVIGKGVLMHQLEKANFFFDCIVKSIDSRCYQILKLLLNNEIDQLIQTNQQLNYSECFSATQISKILSKSKATKDPKIHKLITETIPTNINK